MTTTTIESLPNHPEPLVDSYTYTSKWPTTSGKYMMGVDEAGRGPVLGPLVYAVAFCPVEYKDTLDEMGFNGKKAFYREFQCREARSRRVFPVKSNSRS